MSCGTIKSLGPAATGGPPGGVRGVRSGARGPGAAGAAMSPGRIAPGAKGVAPIRLIPSTTMYVAAQAASP
ncbi:hypothetical protein GCM10010255_50380 [Streptomyces coeruleofuscus]|uniref:Uncharacterized protein n=1 Tax=Streptomyces coeruleofuscus TaxID=66879 RepID=A0ABN3IML1_9ACTN